MQSKKTPEEIRERELLKELIQLTAGEYEPQIIEKHQTRLSGDIEEKIISMYAKGMTQNDISSHIQDMYGFEVSDSVVKYMKAGKGTGAI
jgi:transposase-like protein